MPHIVKCGLVESRLAADPGDQVDAIRDAQLQYAQRLIESAAGRGVQLLSFPELFTTPYFCADQDPLWFDAVESIPEGPTTKKMRELAARHSMVIVMPLFEEDAPGVYYNSAAVIDADGRFVGTYRKNHIPHLAPSFWEKYYFRPGNLGYPVFETRYAKVGVSIGHDRHFPEAGRELGLAGAEIVLNSSAAVSSSDEDLWQLELPAQAVANGYFIAAVNRRGDEPAGSFFGRSYVCDPMGQIVASEPHNDDDVIVTEIDLDLIRQSRDKWQFYRDRRPETYRGLVRP